MNNAWSRRPWLAIGFWPWAWSHRTKALGTAGLVCGYVLEHQGEMGFFMSAPHVAQVLEGFGALGFALGVYNTFFVKK